MGERWVRGAVIATGILIGVAGGAEIIRTFPRSIEPVKTPGGLWVSPKDGETTGSSVHFDARAYPNPRHIGPEIREVKFTVSWDGRLGAWIVACTVVKPVQEDRYKCDWDPSKEPEEVPQGKLKVSFDVFDSKGNVNEAPNGVRTINYQQK